MAHGNHNLDGETNDPNLAGVFGKNTGQGGVGVAGVSDSGDGVRAVSNSGNGLSAFTSSGNNTNTAAVSKNKQAAKLGPEALPHLIRLVQEGDRGLASKATYLAGFINADQSTKIRPPDPLQNDLTPHEVRILKLLVDGHNYRTAAVELGVSVNTVSFHMRHIYGKLQVHSKSEAVSKALRSNLIP